MFANCSYHVLDSLVPPSHNADLSPLSLENICACEIVKISESNCEILRKTPAHLHKILWQTYLKDKYYARDGYLHEVPELLFHWPHKQFILREVMPQFPPKLNRFKPIKSGKSISPYYENQKYLYKFHENVAKSIISTLTKNYSEKFLERHAQHCKLKTINLCGIYTFNRYGIKDMLGINEPSLRCRIDKRREPPRKIVNKIELIHDVDIDAGISSFDADLGYRLNWLAHPHTIYLDYFHPQFSHISLRNYYDTLDGPQLGEILMNNKTVSITLGHNPKIIRGLEDMFETNISQAESILAVKMPPEFSSLNIVRYLKNLVHLDCSENVNYQTWRCVSLNTLRHMHRGLLYLNLNKCYLTNADLNYLKGTRHLATLRELDLGANCFSYDESSNNLVDLCQNLTNIQHLNLKKCRLESWPSDEIAKLFDAFKIMPKIKYINLYDNIFSIETIKMHAIVLQLNISLKYLHLSLPREVKKCYAKSFCADINEKLNDKRLQVLYVDFVT